MRARNLKPGLFKNEILGAADPLYALTYAGLWCLADCEGRLEDRPARIHVEINPWRALGDTERALAWLAKHGFMVRYQVADEAYIWLPKFRKHQSPHIQEKQKGSRLPEYVEHAPVPTPEHNGSDTGAASERNHSAQDDSRLMTDDSGLRKPVNGSPRIDSGHKTPDSRLPPEAGKKFGKEEIQKAKKAIREPKHRTFSEHDLATVAGVSIDVIREAKQQIRQSTRRIQ